MEIFKNTNFDFLGKKWPFIIASLVLTVAGIGSLIVKGGPKYGIDFNGGTSTTVRFASDPNEEELRKLLSSKIPGEIVVQKIKDQNDVTSTVQDDRKHLGSIKEALATAPATSTSSCSCTIHRSRRARTAARSWSRRRRRFERGTCRSSARSTFARYSRGTTICSNIGSSAPPTPPGRTAWISS